jgi:hypothetical protein
LFQGVAGVQTSADERVSWRASALASRSIDRAMTERQTQEARIIPLRLIGQATVRPAEAAELFRTGTRTLRPIDVLLLSPILIPLTVVVLLLLLAWFVLWLATVGSLVTVNLIRDFSRAIWRLNGAVLRAP